MRSVMCRRCFTEPGWNAHQPSQIGIDDFQSNRSLDETYRTCFLRGLFAHIKRGFFHERTLCDFAGCREPLQQLQSLNLTEQEKNDLVEFLKSL